MPEEVIEIEGKKYKLTPIEDDDLLDSFTPSLPKPQPEEPVELVDATPKVKGPIEMMKETASRITEARVSKIIKGAKMNKEYEVKIGRDVSNPKYFYGEVGDDIGKEE
jgi:hypothetical protein